MKGVSCEECLSGIDDNHWATLTSVKTSRLLTNCWTVTANYYAYRCHTGQRINSGDLKNIWKFGTTNVYHKREKIHVDMFADLNGGVQVEKKTSWQNCGTGQDFVHNVESFSYRGQRLKYSIGHRFSDTTVPLTSPCLPEKLRKCFWKP